MPSPPTEGAFRAASTANVATMNRDELAEHLVHLRIVRSWSDAAEITANRRARELAAAGAAGSAEAAHVRAGQRSEREARAVTGRADVCAQMPGFESALAAGSVSSGHLDAIAHPAVKLDDTGRARLAASADNYLDQCRHCWRHRRRGIGLTTASVKRQTLDRQGRRHEPHGMQSARSTLSDQHLMDQPTGTPAGRSPLRRLHSSRSTPSGALTHSRQSWRRRQGWSPHGRCAARLVAQDRPG